MVFFFSGIWGESVTFWGIREQGLRKNILGSWGERSFFFPCGKAQYSDFSKSRVPEIRRDNP